MPASESYHNQCFTSPDSEASNRGSNNAVAESGSRRQSRKRGKNGLQKETNAVKDADALVGYKRAGSPAPTRIESAQGTTPRHSPSRNDSVSPHILDALSPVINAPEGDGFDLEGAWTPSVPLSRSPPVDPIEDISVRASSPANSTTIERGGFSSKTPPSSPLTRKSRPASYSAGSHPSHARQSFSNKSLHTQPEPFGASSPPLPHFPQAHFYGLPDIDLWLGNRAREGRSEGPASLLSFADLPLDSLKREKNRADIILLASEDRLNVLALTRDKLTALGALEAVGGTIIDAKILTSDSASDPFRELRPLVSLVIHGPRRRESALTAGEDEDRMPTPSLIASLRPLGNSGATEFQTTVEIYSLSTQKRLSTLLRSQPSPGLPNLRGLPVSVPPPVGNLKLDARGNFLTISSGTSGEIFVFGPNTEAAQFYCLGKFWTSVQSSNDRRYSNSSNSTDPEVSPADDNRGGRFAQFPIMSLSSRWLALVPPGPIACQALPVTIEPSSILMGVPGLDSQNAPSRPPVSCALESPDAEGFINRVARGVAQEVVRGARWLGGQGMQTWHNYWNQNINAPNPPSNRHVYQGDSHLPAGIFPPTHAPEARPTSAEPQLVSIIDLEMLAREIPGRSSDTVAPLATFQPPSGVSFLSFSPDGLAIITATKKGDVQYVWDLKQSRHLRANILLTNPDSEASASSAKVTQLAKFTRLTPSSIVDIEWKGPSGDQFAVITKNGTIHIFDLSLSAFHWPPLRRSVRLVPASAPASPAVTAQPDEPTGVGGVLSSAMKLASKTQPMFYNLRGRSPTTGTSNAVGNSNNSMAFASATGIRGSKVVAAGLSRSVGAATGTVNSLRHAGDNRIHLNNLARNPAHSRVCWSRQGEQSALMVLDGQFIKSFRVSKRRSSSKSGRKPLSVIDTNSKLNLPLPASEQLATLGRSSNPIATGEASASGYWALSPAPRPPQPSRIVHPLSRAEIETNAPFQPFHSDRRVNLFVYSDASSAPVMTDTNEPWIFGEDIATTGLDIRAPAESDEEEQNSGASVLYRHTSMTSGEPIPGGSSAESMTGQVVVTTRRRKNKTPHQSVVHALGKKKLEDDDGFFEDDCDVLDFAEDRV